MLRPRTRTTGSVTKRKAMENKGAAGSPAKKIKIIKKNEHKGVADSTGLESPITRVTRSISKGQVAVQVTRKNPVRKCRLGNAKTK